MMCSFASSEISGMAMTWFTVCVAIVLRRLRLSTAPAAFGSTYIVLAPIVPPVVVTFQTPNRMFIGPPVEVPFASVRTLNVQLPAGMTVSFGAAAPSMSTIQPRPFGGASDGAPFVRPQRGLRSELEEPSGRARRDRHGGRVHRAGRRLQRVVGDRRLRRRGSAAEVLRRGVVDGGIDRVGEGELGVVEVEREEPFAAGPVELPARLGRRDVPAVAVEDCDRSNAKAGAVGAGRDEHASVNPQLRLELSGAEPPAPGALALTLANGQKLFGARRGDDDRLGAERGGAHRAALESVPVAAGSVLAGERDRAGRVPDGVAGVAELDLDAGRRPVAALAALGAEGGAQEAGCGDTIARRNEGGGAAGDRSDEREEDEPERPHGHRPGMCRAIRRPQFFVGRQVCVFRCSVARVEGRVRAQEASTLAAPYLRRNTHLNSEIRPKITQVGYTVGKSGVRGASRMFKPNATSGDRGLAEIERGRRETGSSRGRGSGVERVCRHRAKLDLNLRSSH